MILQSYMKTVMWASHCSELIIHWPAKSFARNDREHFSSETFRAKLIVNAPLALKRKDRKISTFKREKIAGFLPKATNLELIIVFKQIQLYYLITRKETTTMQENTVGE